MGFDVKAAADQVIAAVDTVQAQAPSAAQMAEGAQAAAGQMSTAIAANPGSFISYTIASVVLMSIVNVIWRSRHRIARALEEGIFSNWRLALLTATGVVLSLASGYTTWDGMRNFTGEGVLSLMVTFGIQGVMLIAAWLIGESFAIGMNQHGNRPSGERRFGLDPVVANLVGAIIGIALFVAVLTLIMGGPTSQDFRQVGDGAFDWGKLSNRMLIIVTGLLTIALISLYAASDLVRPYLQSGRIVIRNLVLWVMFLACMATSVFFSFDSLFTAIFPQSERVRAAELRAQNQVAGIIADIENKITESRLEEAQSLFHAPGFETYDAQLTKLIERSRGASAAIDAYFTNQIEERNRAVKQQQERVATAEAGQAGLAGKKTSLAEELSRLKSERPEQAADFAQKKADVEAKAKETDAKRVEAMAEAGGVEGTGKEGHGPVYRQRMDELAKLQATVKIAEERLNDAKKRLTATETRIASIEREQSTLDGDLAKLKGEAETAGQRIKLAQEQLPQDQGARIDPSRIIPAFEGARASFREEPTVEKLGKVQQLCSQIYTAMAATPATKKEVSDIDCDPKQATEAASVVFALNAGSDAFAKTCKGGERLNQYTSADALFGFARKCLADSGLPSKETDQLRTKINFVELNRDDKAHRFVVTWNAFQDGNRLAYLALSIAIAIDALVFMSGLFGANAVRSPLSDVPRAEARSAKQLDDVINAALGGHPAETAQMVLKQLKPRTNDGAFTSEVNFDQLDKPTADRVRAVLTAGSDLNAVEVISHNPERYKVRRELRTYLASIAANVRLQEASTPQARRAKLELLVATALRPHIHEHAEIVIRHVHPIRPVDGFTSTIFLADLSSPNDGYDLSVVRKVIGAGQGLDVVTPDKAEVGRFYLKPDLYEALLMLSAHSPRSPTFEDDRRRFFADLARRNAPLVTDGGSLNQHLPQMPPPVPQRTIAAPEPRPEKPNKFDIPGFLSAAGNAQGPHHENRQQDFVASLVAALGINSNTYIALSGSAFGAALAAGDAFAALRRANAILDKRLTECEADADLRFQNAYESLKSQIPASRPEQQEQLAAAFQDVDQNWQVLMLMPGGPFERQMLDVIHQLEPPAGEGSLNPQDLSLLDAARRLRQVLAYNPRNSESAWIDLEAALNAQSIQAGLPERGGKAGG